ncbi:MAG: hypothetical protein AB7I19_07415 [Planctomycetota bacterium]
MKRVVALAALCSALTAAPTFAQATGSCGTSNYVGVPIPPDAVDTRLYDVFGLGPNDVWAVGQSQIDRGNNERAGLSWALHWDGSSFAQSATPSPAIPNLQPGCSLFAVGGAAPNDVWAAGSYSRQSPTNGHIGPQIFLLHFDGNSWRQVPEPLPRFSYIASSSGSHIRRIVAHASNDVWFFGWWSGDELTSAGPLVLHWDGSSISFRDIGSYLRFGSWSIVDVAALAPGQYFALASPRTSGYRGGVYPTGVMQWQGNGWVEMPPPPTATITYYSFRTIAASAASDVWVGGIESPLTGNTTPRPYAVRWDGNTWTRHPTTGFPNKIIANGPNDAWAFGSTIEHWDGVRWNVVTDYGSDLASAQSLSAFRLGPCDYWTVGSQIANNQGLPVLALAAHLGGPNEGRAALRLPCTAEKLRHSILPLNTPRIGRQVRVMLDDPTRISGLAGPAATAWMLALGPAPGAPCGVVIPGLGANGGVGELLVDASAVISPTTATWSGPGHPVQHAFPVPNDAALVGVQLTSQAAFLTGSRVLLTSAIDYTIGN